MQKIYIYLENGTFLEANSFGAAKTAIGKLVFNNTTFGYQDSITDPSNAGLFINFTAVEIGNSGINSADMESSKAQAIGVLVRNYHDSYSNYRAEQSLESFLKEHDVIGICDIDTRFLTKILREEGSQMMVASTEISSKDELKKLLDGAKSYDEIDFISKNSTKENYIHKSGVWNSKTQEFNKANMSDKKVVVLDFGAKKSFLNELVDLGLEVEVVPYNTDIKEIIKDLEDKKLNGVVLSSGAGNPNIYKNEIDSIKKLQGKNIPILAVGLGHYLLAISKGAKVEKIETIKHGSHPIKGQKNVEIYSLNTNYILKEFENFAEESFTKLFDKNCVALNYIDEKYISSEFVPTGNSILFKDFLNNIK